MKLIATNRQIWPLIFIGLPITLLIIYLSIPKKWEEATKTGDDGAITLANDWAETIERKQEQFAEHELYALTAARAGYFRCDHCPGRKFFLKEFEVYRYGTTGNGRQGRGHSDSWLAQNALNYNIILTADLTTVKIEETALIGSYAILPENLTRPLAGTPTAKPYWYRLVLPPGNNSLE